jgi:hypothetical protein
MMLSSMFLGNQPASARVANPKISDSPAVNTTIVVSPTAMHNWFFYNDENDQIDNSLGTFVYGPGTPVASTGSTQISVTGTQRRNIATYQFAGTHLANITTLAFSTYNPSTGNGGSANRSAYLQFNVDFTGTSDAFQKRLLFIPSQNGTVTQNSWKEWNAINGGAANWTYSGATWPAPNAVSGGTPKTWNQILADYPNARIKPTDSFLGLRVGEPYTNGYTENIDSLKFGTASGTTTFDFERGVQTLVVDDNGAQCNAPYSTIQSAINAALPGDIVLVCAGTYVEQLDINKAITLRGLSQAGIIIQSPASLATKYTTTYPHKPVVFVHDTNAVIQNLTIDGAGQGNANNRMLGVDFHNAGGTIDHTTITRVRNNPFDGVQAGVAVYALTDDATSRTLNVDHSILSDYQKNGTVFHGTGLTVNFTNNTVTGHGPTNITAQNGVQISGGATGIVSGNTISGHSYTPFTTVATGVIVFDAPAQVLNNTLTENQVAIYHINSAAIDDGNTISVTGAGTGSPGFYGIIMDDPPANRQPSPFDAPNRTGSKSEAPASVQMSRATNNILNSDGTANGIAIESDGGYGTPDLDFLASGNVVNHWDYGIVVYQCPSGCTGSNFTNAIATRNTVTNNRIGMSVEGGHINPVVHFNNNHLSGNTEYGIRNIATTTTVDATNNWWGAVTGPITPGGSPISPLVPGDPVGPNVNYTPFLVGQDYTHLTPGNEVTVSVGSPITLGLFVNAAQAAIAQQSYMTFPTNLLQVSGAALTPDTTSFSQVLQNQVCNGPASCTFGLVTAAPGTIAYASGVTFAAPGMVGDFRVAQVTFTTNTVGDATVHWQFSPTDPANRNSKITDANSNLVSDGTLYQDYVIHVVNPQFRGHVTWQGRPAQPNALQALPIHVTLTNGGTDYPFDTTTDANGNFAVNVNALPNGVYTVRVKGPQYLSTTGGPVTLTGAPSTSVLEFGLQPAGDANNDNLVDITDFSILHATFAQLPFAAPYDARADFTGDNLVDITDFSLLSGNFGRLGNQPAMAPSEQKAGGAVLELRPQGKAPANGGTVHVGDRFVLELWVKAQPGTGVVAQQGYLGFPANKLSLGLGSNMSPIAGGTGRVTADSSVLDIALQNAICNGPKACAFNGVKIPAGSLAFASATLNPTPATGAFRIGEVTVQATAAGTSVLRWQFSPQNPNDRNTKIVTSSGVTVSQSAQFVDYVLNVLPAGK